MLGTLCYGFFDMDHKQLKRISWMILWFVKILWFYVFVYRYYSSDITYILSSLGCHPTEILFSQYCYCNPLIFVVILRDYMWPKNEKRRDGLRNGSKWVYLKTVLFSTGGNDGGGLDWPQNLFSPFSKALHNNLMS